MKARIPFHYLAFFLILAALAALYALLFGQVSAFTITHRDFSPSPASIILLTSLFFVLLLAIWMLYAKAASSLLVQQQADVMSRDFLTFLPIIFLSLTPLSLTHYISAGDLRSRLVLFLWGIAGAFLYLKVAETNRWAAAGSAPWQEWGRRFVVLSDRKKLLLLFLAGLLVFNTGSLLMTAEGFSFTGDEPHYLMISHSLLHDHDFDLANNYARKDYSGFMLFEGEIAPHVVTGAEPGRLYSFHSPGVAFLLLPFYALGGLLKGKAFIFVIRLGMSLWAALFAVQVYLMARCEWGKEGLAGQIWFLTSFVSPVFFYAIHVYPEIIVAFLALVAFRLLRHSPAQTSAKAALCGLCLASFVWFHALKYIALFVPFYAYGIWTILKKSRSKVALVLYLVIPAAVILLYLQFQHALYGTYSLFAVSWARPMTGSGEGLFKFAGSVLFEIPLRDRLETLIGYFLDQRDGLLFYSPLYFFAFLGAWEMLKRKRRDLLILLFLASPYVLLSAALTQRTGYAPQARPLVAVIWALVICLGYFLNHNRKTVFSRLAHGAAAAGFLLTFLLLRHPASLYQETTRGATQRGGGLFYLLSNLHFDLTRWLPSFLKVEDRNWLPNLVWPAIIALFVAVYSLSKKRTVYPKFFFHVALSSAGVVVFFVWLVLYPRLVLVNPTRITLPAGGRITFYSLSRSARLVKPVQFFLREDNRTYRFYLTTGQPIEELGITLGSTYSEYDCALKIFDQTVFQGRTAGGLRSLRIPHPPRYKLGSRSFYEIFLDLGKGSGPIGDQKPFQFELQFPRDQS
jgi:hypothetical protein